MDILGLFDQVERILDIYFTQFPLRMAYGAIGKFIGTRRTFMLVAKISSFVDILGLIDQT